MSMETMKRASQRARSVRRDCCEDECPSGSRNNYFLGKRLTPDGYRLEQDYLVGRRHLLNRAILGWGVVYGFAVGRDQEGALTIGEGLALDQAGRELVQARSAAFALDNLLILDGDGRPVRVDGDLDERLSGLGQSVEDCWLLRAHYAEQKIGPLTLEDPCSCPRREWDRTCETIVYSLQRVGCETCCAPQPCGLACRCAEGPCCTTHDAAREELAEYYRQVMLKYQEALDAAGDNPHAVAQVQHEFEPEFERLAQRWLSLEPDEHPRGGCTCLCEHLTGLEIGAECGRPRDVDDCTEADLGNAIDLACLRLGRNDCGKWSIAAIADPCGPRRLVKRNDLLFDLINGCDVTRIVETGWAAWHRREQPIPFDRFAAALGWNGQEDYSEYEARDFWVRFSRPVRSDTLRPDCFAMTVSSGRSADRSLYYRVPIVDVVTEPGDMPDHSRKATIVVDGTWLNDLMQDPDSIALGGDTRIEIEVRGDFIEDCVGQTVSAHAHGRRPYPSAAGAPGGSYLSAFTVGRYVAKPAQQAKPNTSRPARGRAPTGQ